MSLVLGTTELFDQGLYLLIGETIEGRIEDFILLPWGKFNGPLVWPKLLAWITLVAVHIVSRCSSFAHISDPVIKLHALGQATSERLRDPLRPGSI